MPSTRKVLYTFLASPDNLQEERKAAYKIIAGINESLADELGYQIEPLGWEDTPASFGRPQAIINQDVDRCDLFIGLIWKRWEVLLRIPRRIRTVYSQTRTQRTPRNRSFLQGEPCWSVQENGARLWN